MSVRYLLSCPGCQKQVPVEAGRAGGNVTCACGQTIEVPTVRALRELPQEEAPPRTASGGQDHSPGESNWGPKQGVLFLGFLILLAGGLPTLYKVVTYPQAPFRTPEQIADLAEMQFDQMTVTQSWHVWKTVIEEQGLSNQPTIYEAQYEAKMAEQNQWLMIFGFVTVCGVLILLGGLFMRN